MVKVSGVQMGIIMRIIGIKNNKRDYEIDLRPIIHTRVSDFTMIVKLIQ